MFPSSATGPATVKARFEALLEVAESISTERQLATLFSELSRSLKRLVEFDYITLTLVDFEERWCACTFWNPTSADRRASGPAGFFRDTDHGGARIRAPILRAAHGPEMPFGRLREILAATASNRSACCHCAPRNARSAD